MRGISVTDKRVLFAQPDGYPLIFTHIEPKEVKV